MLRGRQWSRNVNPPTNLSAIFSNPQDNRRMRNPDVPLEGTRLGTHATAYKIIEVQEPTRFVERKAA